MSGSEVYLNWLDNLKHFKRKIWVTLIQAKSLVQNISETEGPVGCSCLVVVSISCHWFEEGKKINNLQQSCSDLPMQDMNRGFLAQSKKNPTQENGHYEIVDSLFKMKKEMHHNTHKPLLQMRLHIHRPIRIYCNQFPSLIPDSMIRTFYLC